MTKHTKNANSIPNGALRKNADDILKIRGKPKEISPHVTMLLAFCRFVMLNKLMMMMMMMMMMMSTRIGIKKQEIVL